MVVVSALSATAPVPARPAAMHDDSPAAPTMDAITVSTDSWDAIVSRADAPHSTRVGNLVRENRRLPARPVRGFGLIEPVAVRRR